MGDVTNLSAYLQASKTYQSVAASSTQAASSMESTLTSIYESLDVSASVTLELSGSGSLLDTYKTDTEKVNAMKADLDNNIGAVKQMVLKLLDTQGNVSNVATDNLHKLVKKITENGGIEQLAKSEAEALISEDGYWGVKQTSQRILDFASALSGGNPGKLDLLRNAFQEGFRQAESLWGGELPEISKKTYDSVMNGFDAWTSGATVSATSLLTGE